ncbi:MAG TPA: universal stress protein [Polyangia bacterium]|jgi:amino acid transporter/nucleotide-binding universal stress UspA family protein|nr:universal stress protein [Polyangia bacterium]
MGGAAGRGGDRGVGHLGPLLAWAVVFADLGTSVFYVPGILYAQSGTLAPAFVLIATIAFVFVAFEHLEIAHRYPKGGGGVAAAVEAFSPRVGVVSGALMVSAYLLTITISIVSALHYVAALHPFPHEIPVLSVLAILVLGFLHWIGIRELARVALVLSLATLVVEGTLIAAVIVQLSPSDWADLWGNLGHLRRISWGETMTGFAGAWLAYSGLESLGQLAPAVREPRQRVIRIAAALVVGSVLITVPLFTALAVEAANTSKIAPQGALLAPVALKYGGRGLLTALALTGAGLLFIAANVSFIGCYNVFKAVSEHGYLPAAMTKRNRRYGTPRGAIIAITIAAIVIVVSTGANLLRLGKIFAFGLLGSYAITSISLNVLRWREGRRGVVFGNGVVATLALVVPWVTSWFTKPHAAIYAAVVTGVQLVIALATHRGWIRSGRFGYIRAASAERAASEQPSCGEVVTLEEAVSLKFAYPSTTLVALRGPNRNLCAEAARRARGVGDTAVYVIFVDEMPGLFFPPRTGPSDDALDVLNAAVYDLRKEGVEAVPVWRIAHDAGASIAEAAEELGVGCVIMGTTQRSTVWTFLRGDVLKQLIATLPDSIHVVICE